MMRASLWNFAQQFKEKTHAAAYNVADYIVRNVAGRNSRRWAHNALHLIANNTAMIFLTFLTFLVLRHDDVFDIA